MMTIALRRALIVKNLRNQFRESYARK